MSDLAQRSWFRLRRIPTDLRAATAQSGVLFRKPAVGWSWLASARRAQIVAVVLIVVSWVVAPFVLDTVVGWVFPPQTEMRSQFFGLVRDEVTEPHPNWTAARAVAGVAWWVGALTLVVGFFWLAIPAGIQAAVRKSRAREQQGDAYLSSQPSRSLAHYQAALTLAPDPATEVALREKVSEAEARLREDDGLTATVAEPPATAGALPETVVGGPGGATIAPEPSAPAVVAENLASAPASRITGRYRLDTEIARGGMGVVHAGHDETLDRPVAVKELPLTERNPEMIRRFRQEAQALARLTHPHIVQVFDLVEDAGRLWMVMERVDGGNLSDRLKTGSFSTVEVIDLLVPVAEALAYAHEHGVVHRDVKPLNVLLTRGGEPKLGDFGLARLAEATVHTVEGAVLGSPRYMSPEQASGEAADARSDIYAFGVSLFEVLTGSPPFEGDVAGVLAQHLTAVPPRLQDLLEDCPPALDRLVAEMLAKDPADRPESMAAVASALATL